ncbi:hypothetical protein Ahia01_000798700 [Argonauta hians]
MSENGEPLASPLHQSSRHPVSRQATSQYRPSGRETSRHRASGQAASLHHVSDQATSHDEASGGLTTNAGHVTPLDTNLANVLDNCPICFNPWTSNHRPVSLRCGHLFGQRCLKMWMYIQGNTCPQCNCQAGMSDLQAIFTDDSSSHGSEELTIREPQRHVNSLPTANTIVAEGEKCTFCFDAFMNSGNHRPASLKCGHLFGQSCIEKWLRDQGERCPQCNSRARRNDIRIIFSVNSSDCNICLNSRTTGRNHRPVSLRCGHVFGQSCIYWWLRNHGERCPQCNSKARRNDIWIIFSKFNVQSHGSEEFTIREPQRHVNSLPTANTVVAEGEKCTFCFDAFMNSGNHRPASLKCGHLFGQSCIEKWLRDQGERCPQCNSRARRNDIRIIFSVNSSDCNICLNSRTTGRNHRPVSLRCGHVFGQSCIYWWLRNHGERCPQCNSKARRNDIWIIFSKFNVQSHGSEEFTIREPHRRVNFLPTANPVVAEGENCTICFNPWTRNHRPASLRCGHVFGQSCIDWWLREQGGRCPQCNNRARRNDIRIIITDNFLSHENGMTIREPRSHGNSRSRTSSIVTYTKNCPICFNPWNRNHRPVSLRCGHLFGQSCFENWMRDRGERCPQCNCRVRRTDIRIIITDNALMSENDADHLATSDHQNSRHPASGQATSQHSGSGQATSQQQSSGQSISQHHVSGQATSQNQALGQETSQHEASGDLTTNTGLPVTITATSNNEPTDQSGSGRQGSHRLQQIGGIYGEDDDDDEEDEDYDPDNDENYNPYEEDEFTPSNEDSDEGSYTSERLSILDQLLSEDNNRHNTEGITGPTDPVVILSDENSDNTDNDNDPTEDNTPPPQSVSPPPPQSVTPPPPQSVSPPPPQSVSTPPPQSVSTPPPQSVRSPPHSPVLFNNPPQPPAALPPASNTDHQTPKRRRVNSPPKADTLEDDDNCPICFDAWTTSGNHRPASLRCGHLFGQSCIEKWLRGQGEKCPQCNSRARRNDIRVIFTKNIRAVDTVERDRALQDLARCKQRNAELNLELAELGRKYQLDSTRFKNELQDARNEIKFLRSRLMDSKNASPSDLSVSAEYSMNNSQETSGKGQYKCDKTILIWEGGNCRVMTYSSFLGIFVVSQPSSSPLFQGFGVRKVSVADFRTTEYLPLHTKLIRCICFHPTHCDGLLLSCAMDKKIKLTSLISNTVVQQYDVPLPAWSCVWNSDDHNYFYAGLQNGLVLEFDVRNTDTFVRQINTEGSRSPVVSLQFIPAAPFAHFRPGGLLVGQLDRISFYEKLSNDEYRLHLLPLEGNLTSLFFETHTRQLLASFRNSAKFPKVRHLVCEMTSVMSDDHNICSCNVVQTFYGGSPQTLLTKTSLVQHPTDKNRLFICAGEELASAVNIWDGKTFQHIQKLHCGAPVLDICAFSTKNNTSYLLALTEKQVKLHKWCEV